MRYSTILGIESSCDDTAAAIWKGGKILANVVAGQNVHRQWGGVVPELASRAHQSNIIPVVHSAIETAGITATEISAIAFTRGPGLMGSLLVGIQFAKGLALGLNVPIIGVHHLQAHVAALYIDNPDVAFPILCLLVSGGHTQLLWVQSPMEMEIVGTTLDDAAGEAFDKGAKMMGLPYPGGPMVDLLAKNGDDTKYQFNAGKVPNLDFSFSGIKTGLLYFLRDQQALNPDFIEQEKANICASYQKCIVDYLIQKTSAAIDKLQPKSIAIVGGVSANSSLRKAFINLAGLKNLEGIIPDFAYCTDNAAMIAIAGHYLLESGQKDTMDILPFMRG